MKKPSVESVRQTESFNENLTQGGTTYVNWSASEGLFSRGRPWKRCMEAKTWSAKMREELSSQTMISSSTLQQWYYHFLLYGKTMPETRLWEMQGYSRYEERNSSRWKEDDTIILKEIVREEPWLFLERQNHSGGRWIRHCGLATSHWTFLGFL